MVDATGVQPFGVRAQAGCCLVAGSLSYETVFRAMIVPAAFPCRC
jgi:hypothetical protein